MRLLRLAERRPRKESDAVLLAIVDDEVGFAVGKAVAVLHRDDRHNPASALNVFASHVRERDMTNFALLAQPGQRFHRSLERNGIIGRVELMNIDAIEAQTLHASLKSICERV